MGLGAPWTRPPDVWLLDGHRLRVRTPSTTALASAICLPDKEGAGLFAALECTVPADRLLLLELIDSNRPTLALFDDVADVLVQKIVGWKRWEAAHIWRETLDRWPVVEGELRGAGVDLAALGPASATHTAFAWWRRTLGRDKEEWARFVREMEREPVRVIEREAEVPMDPGVFDRMGAEAALRRRRAHGVAAEVGDS